MLKLASRLVLNGLRVSVATTEWITHRMLKQNPTTTAAATSTGTTTISDIELMFYSDGVVSLDRDGKPDYDRFMDRLGKVGPINLSNLIKDRYQKKKLACIISNPFLPWVVDVAAKYEIPCAMLWVQPCALYSIYYHFYNNLNEFPTLANPNAIVELPGLPILLTQDLPSLVLPSQPFVSSSKSLCNMFQNVKKYKWVLANSFFELEKETIESTNDLCAVQLVGPLVPSSLLGQDSSLDVQLEMWKPDETCVSWLDKQKASSVIYVSFGSVLELSAKQMEEIATALKNLKSPFVWVVNEPEIPSDDRKGELPVGFYEETKNQGLVVSWSPQTRVLANPAIGCFITHCGWNSLLETIVAGVPVIAYPRWSDQPTNAKLIVDVFKVGLRLILENDCLAGHEEIEKCVEEVMLGPKSEEFKKRCTEPKLTARAAVADGGQSDKNIQTFVNEIMSSYSK